MTFPEKICTAMIKIFFNNKNKKTRTLKQRKEIYF